jgi:SAM-dependent methyltransferase
MKLLEFRKLNLNDTYNDYYNDGYAWSRVYEYELVNQMIIKYSGYNKDYKIHNTSWGFQGIHIKYKNILDELYPLSIHSDILYSDLPKTLVLDITKSPNIEMKDTFDIVINISTLEEVSHDHLSIFNNLLEQVKPNGLLICTFDLPGLQVEKFESLFNQKLKTSDNDLNNNNSKLKNLSDSILECGIMVIRK